MVPGSWSGSGGLQSPPEAGLGEDLGGEVFAKFESFAKNLKVFCKIQKSLFFQRKLLLFPSKKR